eukprot:12402463-Karenia_brevis.AAC.1
MVGKRLETLLDDTGNECALLNMISAKAAISACERLGTNSAWKYYLMKCVASACEKGGQWQRVAPLLDEMQRQGLAA